MSATESEAAPRDRTDRAETSVLAGPMPVEAPLHAACVARHRKAAHEEHHHREYVPFVCKAEPSRVLDRLIHSTEDIEEADDGDQRRVLEEIDDVVDDAGHHMAQCLGKHDEGLHLPPFEADRIGGLL